MKFLLNSTTFHPAVGGLENVAMDIALEFMAAGHEVKIVTLIPNASKEELPFEVHRSPSFMRYVQLIRWADISLHFNVTVKGMLPYLFLKSPLVISHQSPIMQTFKKKYKLWLTNKIPILNIGCSSYVAAQYQKSVTIHNSYNHLQFLNTRPYHNRKGDLVYLGRLVSIKGVDTLLEALRLLKIEGCCPQLSIIGDGEERENLMQQTKVFDLEAQVQFLGKKTGTVLVDTLNEHKIMVVPSKWREAFGIVALEGIACGLAVIASEGGGLKDAVGPCGITFPNGDAKALAAAIQQLWNNDSMIQQLQTFAPAHLKQHERTTIAHRYLEVIEEALGKIQK